MNADGFFERGILSGEFLPKLMPHMRQGDIDGACGFYSMTMILDYFELCDPAVDLQDGRESLSRYLTGLQARQLITRGLGSRQLTEASNYFHQIEVEQIVSRSEPSAFEEVQQTIGQQIGRATPCVVRFVSGSPDSKSIDHYAVAVGCGTKSIFLVDAAKDASEGTLFNNRLVSNKKGIVYDIDGWRVESVGPCFRVAPTSFEAKPEHWLPLPWGDWVNSESHI